MLKGQKTMSDQNTSMFGSNSNTTPLQQSRQHKAEG